MQVSLVDATQTTSTQSKTHWLALLKEAVLGSHQDFTAISMNRAIFLLAVPLVLEMVMESLFGIVYFFFVAHHGNGQQKNGAIHGYGGEILMRAENGFFQERQPMRLALRGCGWRGVD